MERRKYPRPEIWLTEQLVLYYNGGNRQPPAANGNIARGIMKAYVADGANQLTERSGQITRFFYCSTRGSLGFDSGLLERPEQPPAKAKETPPPNPNVNKPRAIYYTYKGKTPKS
jgi:hypothetical protein